MTTMSGYIGRRSCSLNDVGNVIALLTEYSTAALTTKIKISCQGNSVEFPSMEAMLEYVGKFPTFERLDEFEITVSGYEQTSIMFSTIRWTKEKTWVYISGNDTEWSTAIFLMIKAMLRKPRTNCLLIGDGALGTILTVFTTVILAIFTAFHFGLFAALGAAIFPLASMAFTVFSYTRNLPWISNINLSDRLPS